MAIVGAWSGCGSDFSLELGKGALDGQMGVEGRLWREYHSKGIFAAIVLFRLLMGKLLELKVERRLLDGDRDDQVVDESVEEGVKGEGPDHYGRGYGHSKIDDIIRVRNGLWGKSG